MDQASPGDATVDRPPDRQPLEPCDSDGEAERTPASRSGDGFRPGYPLRHLARRARRSGAGGTGGGLAGLEIRDCEVSGLIIVDCYGGDVYLGGAFERLVVNDVDVTAYVEAVLDRQHPPGAGACGRVQSVVTRARDHGCSDPPADSGTVLGEGRAEAPGQVPLLGFDDQ